VTAKLPYDRPCPTPVVHRISRNPGSLFHPMWTLRVRLTKFPLWGRDHELHDKKLRHTGRNVGTILGRFIPSDLGGAALFRASSHVDACTISHQAATFFRPARSIIANILILWNEIQRYRSQNPRLVALRVRLINQVRIEGSEVIFIIPPNSYRTGLFLF